MTSKVMPLGDSITQGSGSSDGSGCRKPLYDLIVAGSQTVDFVGSQSGGPFAQPEHEGHGGYTVVQLRDGVAGWVGGYVPTIVLLSAGTNDLLTALSTRAQEHAATLGLLIDDIHAINSAIPVLVSPVPPLVTSQAARARAAQFNVAVKREVDTRALATVVWVPMQWQGSDIGSDGIHPNDAGYANWARAWHRVLRSLLT